VDEANILRARAGGTQDNKSPNDSWERGIRGCMGSLVGGSQDNLIVDGVSDLLK
jgi:hypothetical protein